MKKTTEEQLRQIVATNIRIPRYLWIHLKNAAMSSDSTMNQLIINFIEAHKNKCDKRMKRVDGSV